jgi:energy-converting hydrogenase Eha subunit B
MKQFKAFAADYEYMLSLSDEGQLFCLSERQVYAIMVQLEYIGWLTRWYNTDDITQTTVDRFKSDIAEALMSCVDVSILVDQANENLITTVVNRAIQSQTLRDIYADEYTGTPTSINPSAPTTTWSYSNTLQGDTALCAALMAFVYQYARAQADSVRAGQVGGLAAIALIAVLLIPGLNIFFLVGAAIAVLAGLGTIGVTTEVAITALTDTSALDEVVCCMKDNLKDAAVSQATFEASLGGCGFISGSNAQIVADFLGATLTSNYLTFLDFMGTAYVGAGASEEMPECPCADPPPDPACEDLALAQGLWFPLSSLGVYYPGVGLGPTLISGNYYFIWNRNQETVGRLIVELKYTFNVTPPEMIFTGGSGATVTITPTSPVVILNEANAPALFPFSTLGASDLQVRTSAVNGFLGPSGGGFRLLEACYYE